MRSSASRARWAAVSSCWHLSVKMPTTVAAAWACLASPCSSSSRTFERLLGGEPRVFGASGLPLRPRLRVGTGGRSDLAGLMLPGPDGADRDTELARGPRRRSRARPRASRRPPAHLRCTTSSAPRPVARAGRRTRTPRAARAGCRGPRPRSAGRRSRAGCSRSPQSAGRPSGPRLPAAHGAWRDACPLASHRRCRAGSAVMVQDVALQRDRSARAAPGSGGGAWTIG
jgi:hypothetical protein